MIVELRKFKSLRLKRHDYFLRSNFFYAFYDFSPGVFVQDMQIKNIAVIVKKNKTEHTYNENGILSEKSLKTGFGSVNV